MKRIIALIICGLFFAAGLVRIGVSGMLIGQTLNWWQFDGEAALALGDTQRFIEAQKANIVGFTPLSFFVFLTFMGACLSLGAIGQVWRRGWGLALIGLYLACYAALFANFMTVNPKVVLLGATLMLTLVLAWANSNRDAKIQPLAA